MSASSVEVEWADKEKRRRSEEKLGGVPRENEAITKDDIVWVVRRVTWRPGYIPLVTVEPWARVYRDS